MVECAGLEIRYTVLPYRGFESLLLRQLQGSDAMETVAQALIFWPAVGIFWPTLPLWDRKRQHVCRLPCALGRPLIVGGRDVASFKD